MDGILMLLTHKATLIRAVTTGKTMGAIRTASAELGVTSTTTTSRQSTKGGVSRA
jgi:hypothetical protein